LDLAFDDVSGKTIPSCGDQSFFGLPMAAQLFVSRPCRARGRTSYDHHARLQREIDREEVYEIGAGPDHISRIARLAQFTIDARADIENLGISDFIRGDNARSKRCAGIECLAATKVVPGKTPRSADLTIACGYVVDNGISKYVLKRPLLWDMASCRSDHNSKFRLAIELARKALIKLDRFLRANDVDCALIGQPGGTPSPDTPAARSEA
jgi:hypothetical protein